MGSNFSRTGSVDGTRCHVVFDALSVFGNVYGG